MYELNPTVSDGRPVIPVDLANAIAELDRMIPSLLKSEIKNHGVGLLHRSLGMWIRNHWGLWSRSQVQSNGSLRNYFLIRGFNHADDMSGFLLECYCSHLRGQDVIEPPLPSGDELLRATRVGRQIAFFQSLIDAAKQEGFIGSRYALPQYWTTFSTGIRHVSLNVLLSNIGMSIKIRFQAKSDTVNKARFDVIVMKRDEIEKELDRKLSWKRIDGTNGSSISLHHDGTIDCQPDELEALRSLAIVEMKLIREKLLPHVLIVSEQIS